MPRKYECRNELCSKIRRMLQKKAYYQAHKEYHGKPANYAADGVRRDTFEGFTKYMEKNPHYFHTLYGDQTIRDAYVQVMGGDIYYGSPVEVPPSTLDA